jgi:hypothetical protein
MENLVYYKGIAVGIEVGGRVTWFTSATPEAIAALKG